MIAQEFSINYYNKLLSLTIISSHLGYYPYNIAPINGLFLFIKSLLSNSNSNKTEFILKYLYSNRTLNNPIKYSIFYNYHLNLLNNNKFNYKSIIGIIS